MIVVIDYGVGNLQSVGNALDNLKIDYKITNNLKDLSNASHIILPGVGAFGQAVSHIKKTGFDVAIQSEIKAGKPFLGICLGMQLLLTSSEEMGFNKGLNIIKGKVKEFPKQTQDKIPQIGWNSIHFKKNNPLFNGILSGDMVYFVHSFYVEPENKNATGAITEYAGIKYTSALWSENIFATQFHPEKSGKTGLKILENFYKIC